MQRALTGRILPGSPQKIPYRSAALVWLVALWTFFYIYTPLKLFSLGVYQEFFVTNPRARLRILNHGIPKMWLIRDITQGYRRVQRESLDPK